MDYKKPSVKNKERITSDNYEMRLFFKVGEEYLPKTGINLTELYGLTDFSFEFDDEIKVFKPVTRLEPMVKVIQRGVNLDFTFIREEIPANDALGHISNLLFMQYTYYFNAQASIDEPEAKINEANGNYRPLGQQNYTDPAKPEIPISRFSEPFKYGLMMPETKLSVRIKELHIDNSGGIKHGYDFFGLTLYHLTEKVSENSSFIINTFKGYASYGKPIYEGSGTVPNAFANYINDSIDSNKSTNNSYGGQLNPSSLNYYMRRVIRNPDNKE